MFKVTSQIFLFSVLTLALTGCRHDLKPGHYEGNLIWQQSTTSSGDPIGIDVRFDHKAGELHPHQGIIELKDIHGDMLTVLGLENLQSSQFDLLLSAVRPEPFHLKRRPKTDGHPELRCFVHDTDWIAEFCYEKNHLTLSVYDAGGVGVFKVMASNFVQEGFFPFEEPVSFPLSDAIRRALLGNLDSRIAFEHIVQAKYSVMTAYLNLIPHLTSNLIWNAQPSFITYIATAQGLVPFLFPSYWLEARQSQWDKKIKEDAEVILKADLAAMVEQMAYAYDRDQQIARIQDETLNSVVHYRAKLTDLETQGKVRAGAAKSLKRLEEKIKSDRQSVANLLREERYALSQALGFHNPEGVQGIEVPPFDPSACGEVMTREDLAFTASRRSFEVQQLDYLKKITSLKKVELFFTWIDPTGDPKSSFGFNTISQVKMANSQLHELELKREQLKIAIFQNAYRVADDYNATLEGLKQSLANPSRKDSDLDQILAHGLKTRRFMPKAITHHVRNYLSQEIGKIANVAAYRISRSKVDRLLLSGYFDLLLPHLGADESTEPMEGAIEQSQL